MRRGFPFFPPTPINQGGVYGHSVQRPRAHTAHSALHSAPLTPTSEHHHVRRTIFFILRKKEMPGKRNCNTCGDRHEPPTGKHCKRQHDSSDDNSETTTLLRSLKDTIGEMNGRLQALEAAQGATSEARSVSPPATASPLKEKV